MNKVYIVLEVVDLGDSVEGVFHNREDAEKIRDSLILNNILLYGTKTNWDLKVYIQEWEVK